MLAYVGLHNFIFMKIIEFKRILNVWNFQFSRVGNTKGHNATSMYTIKNCFKWNAIKSSQMSCTWLPSDCHSIVDKNLDSKNSKLIF